MSPVVFTIANGSLSSHNNDQTSIKRNTQKGQRTRNQSQTMAAIKATRHTQLQTYTMFYICLLFYFVLFYMFLSYDTHPWAKSPNKPPRGTGATTGAKTGAWFNAAFSTASRMILTSNALTATLNVAPSNFLMLTLKRCKTNFFSIAIFLFSTYKPNKLNIIMFCFK